MKEKYWRITGIIPDSIREQFDRMSSAVELSSNKDWRLTDLAGKLVGAAPVGRPFDLVKQFAIWTRGSTVATDLSQTLRNWMGGEENANAYEVTDLSKQPCGFLSNLYFATVQLYRIEGSQTLSDSIKNVDLLLPVDELMGYAETGFRKEEKK